MRTCWGKLRKESTTATPRSVTLERKKKVLGRESKVKKRNQYTGTGHLKEKGKIYKMKRVRN